MWHCLDTAMPVSSTCFTQVEVWRQESKLLRKNYLSPKAQIPLMTSQKRRFLPKSTDFMKHLAKRIPVSFTKVSIRSSFEAVITASTWAQSSPAALGWRWVCSWGNKEDTASHKPPSSWHRRYPKQALSTLDIELLQNFCKGGILIPQLNICKVHIMWRNWDFSSLNGKLQTAIIFRLSFQKAKVAAGLEEGLETRACSVFWVGDLLQFLHPDIKLIWSWLVAPAAR